MEDIDRRTLSSQMSLGTVCCHPLIPTTRMKISYRNYLLRSIPSGPTSGPTFWGTFVIVQGINFTPQTLCKVWIPPGNSGNICIINANHV